MNIYDISASALTAQRLRLDTIASNLANVNTTRNPDGTLGAYKRKNLVFAPILGDASQQQIGSYRAQEILGSALPVRPLSQGIHTDANGHITITAGVQENGIGAGVQVLSVQPDTKTPMRKIYDPSHPDADANGFVEMPNVNAVSEMVDMISASRAYEASVTAFRSAKDMDQATLDI
jgi:flagellar basal-body rod protein FlgC